MSLPNFQLELLAPAKTAEIGREAILHGADAVYIGGPSFGARASADNSVADIAKLVQYAHRFGSRIFVTLNTILHDNELEPARQLITQLYEAGVDALIVQDMGVLELDIPPIQLHASTQTDIRTVEKAKFLSDVGFSQIVLARELTLPQIRNIADAVDSTIEFFIHGALCVAYSGQCFISHAQTGRSANRGDCSQACRLPYTLSDSNGSVVAYEKHLLSMKDNDQTANMAALVDAGVRSFKIEGRYKDLDYVKNITAHYRLMLDEILEQRPDLQRASHGQSQFFFTPNPDKTFNRGKTDYFVTGRKEDIGAFESPKFVGLPIGDVTQIGPDWFELASTEPMANGDGLTYMHKREVVGVPINRAEQRGEVWRLFPNPKMAELPGLKVGLSMSRNRDHQWEQALKKNSAQRHLNVWIKFSETPDGFALTLTDEEGVSATVSMNQAKELAQNSERALSGLRDSLGKLGGTIFNAQAIDLELSRPWFIPASAINALRREAVEQLELARLNAWQRPERKAAVEPPAIYPDESLTYLANVYNDKARAFYAKHGVKLIEAAYEAHQETGEVSLMITKHCLRFSFNLCPKQAKGVQGVQGQIKAEPMTMVHGKETLTLRFDCKPCEMHVMGTIKKHILLSPPPTTVAAPITFHVKRPS